MRRYRKLPSQSWRTYLANNKAAIATVDFFTVPTLTFGVFYVFVVIEHARRCVVHFNVTAHPTAKWIAQQLTEAVPLDTAPKYLIRDGDAKYRDVVARRITALGINDVVTTPALFNHSLKVHIRSRPGKFKFCLHRISFCGAVLRSEGRCQAMQ